MRSWLDSQHDWLRAERLPAYAPELNPVEGLWANLEDVELANRLTAKRRADQRFPRSPASVRGEGMRSYAST
jgi:transposase